METTSATKFPDERLKLLFVCAHPAIDPNMHTPLMLQTVLGLGRPGRFQLEAAIQSVNAERARSGRTDWAAIALFYEHLIRISPTLGTRTGYAAAIAKANGPQAGLAILDTIELVRPPTISLTGQCALTCCSG